MNLGALDAAIVISAPVCGFLPVLAALSDTSKVPNPTNWIFSPFFNSSATTSVNAFKDASASFFDTPAFYAIAATKSALFMIKFLLWIFIIYIIRAVFPNYLQEYIYLFLWGLSRKMRYFLGFYVLLPFLKPYFELNKEVNVER